MVSTWSGFFLRYLFLDNAIERTELKTLKPASPGTPRWRAKLEEDHGAAGALGTWRSVQSQGCWPFPHSRHKDWPCLLSGSQVAHCLWLSFFDNHILRTWGVCFSWVYPPLSTDSGRASTFKIIMLQRFLPFLSSLFIFKCLGEHYSLCSPGTFPVAFIEWNLFYSLWIKVNSFQHNGICFQMTEEDSQLPWGFRQQVSLEGRIYFRFMICLCFCLTLQDPIAHRTKSLGHFGWLY